MNSNYTISNKSASNGYCREWAVSLGDARPEILPFYGHTVTNPVSETCLSQWYRASFTVDGVTYVTAEQFMMAEKARLFGDEEIRAEILAAEDPHKCKSLGRKAKGFDKEIWDREKSSIVERGNLHKFSQNKELREFLLLTGNKIIVEASPMDRIWGIGIGKNNPDTQDPAKWRGRNLLGFALMAVRDRLRGGAEDK